MPRIIIIEESSSIEFELKKENTSIGRQPDCDIVLRDPKLSRRHCLIFLEKGKYFVKDCGSKNGTYLNEVLLKGQKELNVGDKIQIGNSVIIFEKEIPGRDYKPKIRKEQTAKETSPHLKEAPFYTEETKTAFERKEKGTSVKVAEVQNEFHAWANVGRGIWAFMQAIIITLSIFIILTLIIVLIPRKNKNEVRAENLLKSNPSFEEFENNEKPKNWKLVGKNLENVKTVQSTIKKMGEKSLALDFSNNSEPRKVIIAYESNIPIKNIKSLKTTFWTKGKEFDGWISIRLDWFSGKNRAIPVRKNYFEFRRVGLSWRKEEFISLVPNFCEEFRLNIIILGKSGTVLLDDINVIDEKISITQKFPTSIKFGDFNITCDRNAVLSVSSSNDETDFLIEELGYGLLWGEIFSLPTEPFDNSKDVTYEENITSYLINLRNFSRVELISRIKKLTTSLDLMFSLSGISRSKDIPALICTIPKKNLYKFKIIMEIEENVSVEKIYEKAKGIRISGQNNDLVINFVDSIATISFTSDEEDERHIMICDFNPQEKSGKKVARLRINIFLMEKGSIIQKDESEKMYNRAIEMEISRKLNKALEIYSEILARFKPTDKFAQLSLERKNNILNYYNNSLKELKMKSFTVDIEGSESDCKKMLDKIKTLIDEFEGSDSCIEKLNQYKTTFETLRNKISREKKEKQALEMFKLGYNLLESGELEKGLLIMQKITKDFADTSVAESAQRLIDQGGL